MGRNLDALSESRRTRGCPWWPAAVSTCSAPTRRSRWQRSRPTQLADDAGQGGAARTLRSIRRNRPAGRRDDGRRAQGLPGGRDGAGRAPGCPSLRTTPISARVRGPTTSRATPPCVSSTSSSPPAPTAAHVAIGHVCCLDDPEGEMAIALAKRGAYVGFDRVTIQLVPDAQKVDHHPARAGRRTRRPAADLVRLLVAARVEEERRRRAGPGAHRLRAAPRAGAGAGVVARFAGRFSWKNPKRFRCAFVASGRLGRLWRRLRAGARRAAHRPSSSRRRTACACCRCRTAGCRRRRSRWPCRA